MKYIFKDEFVLFGFQSIPSANCSSPEVFRNLKNFAKFTGKHLVSESVFKKFASFMPATLLKKRPQDRCFPVNFFGIFKITFFFFGKPPVAASVLTYMFHSILI